ncbi:MAG: UDP-N-acetylglucosamine 1-carboxyvinyltransferase [Eubacteriales bacterium]|nr:UDP-N-acetylglucosamine 1-carboxyvinyltransferase [Eubacteriales bacterium]
MTGGFVVEGGRRLCGDVTVKGAKNAVLPLLAAALMAEDEVVLEGCPRLMDVENMAGILRGLGCRVRRQGDCLTVDPRSADCFEMPERLSGELRSSIFLLGPILGRFGQAVCSYPGGCEIGLRPIDLHLSGLRALNASIEEAHGRINCLPSVLIGAPIHLDYPSVGATENIMMAAAKARGVTTITNPAKEPEIADLQDFLNAMGARVSGAGSDHITIEGVKRLGGTVYRPITDRIAAGTYLAAAAMTAGDVTVKNIQPRHIAAITAKLTETGCRLDSTETSVRLRAPARLRAPQRLETLPYPGFPTDMQAQMFALACIAKGTTIIQENVFESRYRHAAELTRMGADVTIRDRLAIITGVDELTGAEVQAGDLRGGAALVLAGLVAQGTTTVQGAGYIDRGYERLEEVLGSLGANIRKF